MNIALLDEIILRCDAEPLTDAAISTILGVSSREEFCDALSRRVAFEYDAGRMSFDIADAAMNRLWEFAFLVEDSFIPPYSREVFEAFDEGEFHHSGDPIGTDPEQKYTRPMIREIVARG